MSNLKPDLRKGIWYAVGTINGERIRKSLGTRDKAVADEQCAIYEARLWKRHSYGEEAVRTFEEAALSYMQQGGEGKYLKRVIKFFKGRPVGKIKPADVREMALTIYPAHAPSTRNRQAIVPARAVINHAHDRGWCGAISVKQFEVAKSRKNKPVDRQWLDRFIAEADRSNLPHLSALVLFMHQTGSRVSEAIRVEGQHVDIESRVALLETTKTDEWSPRYLTAELVVRMVALGLNDGERVFGYTDRQAVNRRMKAVARRAKIEERSSHAAGRHSFATNAINGGAKIKDAMDAGGWKSARLFMETYVHSDEGGRNVVAIFDRQTGPIDATAAQAIERRRPRFGKNNGKR